MRPSTLLAVTLSVISELSSAAALPLNTRQYPPTASTSFPTPFNILIRPVNLGLSNVYLDPLYLSQISDSKAVALHSSSATPATFTLKKGILSTSFKQATTWSNMTPDEGQFLTFIPSKTSARDMETEASSDDNPVIRIGAPGAALLLLSVDNDTYAFFFCSSTDGKKQYGLSVGKRRGKNVKCVNVYLEAVPAVIGQ